MKSASRRFRFLAVALTLAANGKGANAQLATPTCVLEGSTDVIKGAPTIYGTPYDVPALHLRFERADTHEPLTPKSVDIHYYWHWLEYPYPEHPTGAWSDGEDLARCVPTESSHEILAAARQVKPRGWYAGKYARFPWATQPKFDRVEIVIVTADLTSRLTIRKDELKRYRDKIATVQLSNGVPKATF